MAWDDSGRWLGEIQPSISSLVKALAEYDRVVNKELVPLWYMVTDAMELTGDNWDYLLARVHDRLPTEKKECMFEKENDHAKS